MPALCFFNDDAKPYQYAAQVLIRWESSCLLGEFVDEE
jgi:hypothetical protein